MPPEYVASEFHDPFVLIAKIKQKKKNSLIPVKLYL